MSFDFLSGIGALGGGILGYILPFLFVLTIVVFFHELGHFLVARWCGVRVLTFSIGFGPELFGFNDRHGTRWKISAIPLGGYVKFFGDENAASVPDPVGARQHDRGRTPGELRPSEGGTTCRHRGGRSAGEFRPGDRDLLRPVHDLRQAEHDRRASTPCSQTAPPPPPASSPATSCCRSMAGRSTASPTCSAS